MRNLYMYYKRLKVAIQKKQTAASANGAAQAQQKRSSSVASANSNNSAVTSGSRALSADSGKADRPISGGVGVSKGSDSDEDELRDNPEEERK